MNNINMNSFNRLTIRNNNKKNNNGNNYRRYTIKLKRSPENDKNYPNSEWPLNDTILRAQDFVNIINKAIVYSNKVQRRLRRNNAQTLRDIIYQEILPLTAISTISHPVTGESYSIYGYLPMLGIPAFPCRGSRKIKGSKDRLHNNMNQCIDIPSLAHITLEAGYSVPLKHYFLKVLLYNRVIAIIDDNNTFMNALTTKEKHFVQISTKVGVLSRMSSESSTVKGTNFLKEMNLGYKVDKVPNKNRKPRLRISEDVLVQEIPKINK